MSHILPENYDKKLHIYDLVTSSHFMNFKLFSLCTPNYKLETAMRIFMKLYALEISMKMFENTHAPIYFSLTYTHTHTYTHTLCS